MLESTLGFHPLGALDRKAMNMNDIGYDPSTLDPFELMDYPIWGNSKTSWKKLLNALKKKSRPARQSEEGYSSEWNQ